jgi:hypothetical protein
VGGSKKKNRPRANDMEHFALDITISSREARRCEEKEEKNHRLEASGIYW